MEKLPQEFEEFLEKNPKLKDLFSENNKALEQRIIRCAMFLMAFEVLRNNIIEKVKDFFWEGYSNGKNLYSEKYNNYYGEKNHFKRACEWFLECQAINEDDMALIKTFNSWRNDIGHELFAVMLDNNKSELHEIFIQLITKLNFKIDNWWIREIEATIDPESWSDKPLDGAASASTYLLDYIYHKFYESYYEGHADEQKTKT